IIRKQAGLALSLPKFVVALVLTGLVTEASYRFLEMPVRRREFFQRLRTPTPQVLMGMAAVALLTGYGGVSLLTADLRCTTKIECDAEAARDALAQSTTTTQTGNTQTSTTGTPNSDATGNSDATTTSTTAAVRQIP
ncbi:MAG TPA: hypothetical protein PLV68_12750, partial [Ilumatobacteraceae bacterium]|nr:hypothetical protein [Ilumatobacteraceae bacterium]